jgi:hypothetical protein
MRTLISLAIAAAVLTLTACSDDAAPELAPSSPAAATTAAPEARPIVDADASPDAAASPRDAAPATDAAPDATDASDGATPTPIHCDGITYREACETGVPEKSAYGFDARCNTPFPQPVNGCAPSTAGSVAIICCAAAE